MNASAYNRVQPNPHTDRIAEHAIVVGASVAGLIAARVLADYVERVTVIDRDHVSADAVVRRGAPQARHPHALLLRGKMVLEQLFPGLTDELTARDANVINPAQDVAVYAGAERRVSRRHLDTIAIAAGRPLLESTIYGRLVDHPAVEILSGYEAIGLLTARRRNRVAGVQLRSRHSDARSQTELVGDIVVDASGRSSRAPTWLAQFGFTPPRETTVIPYVGYASRIYHRPPNVAGDWRTMYVRPMPPFGTRGGMILPVEGDRWHVALIGTAYDYPSTDEEEFLRFARSLPTPALYDAIRAAEPASDVSGYRRTENRRRHYEDLPHALEGFLVTGDAAIALNPIYAQGISAAALGGVALKRALAAHRAQRAAGDVTGLATRFQHMLHETVGPLWERSVRADQMWPATDTVEETATPATYRLAADGRHDGRARPMEYSASTMTMVPAR